MKALANRAFAAWFNGVLWGFAVNGGLVLSAMVAFVVVSMIGWAADWDVMQASIAFIVAACVWAPLGWAFSCATLMEREQIEGHLHGLRDGVVGD